MWRGVTRFEWTFVDANGDDVHIMGEDGTPPLVSLEEHPSCGVDPLLSIQYEGKGS